MENKTTIDNININIVESFLVLNSDDEKINVALFDTYL
jgi:hypothetical protein